MTPQDLPGVSELSNRVHIKYPERQAVLEEKFRLYPLGCFVLEAVGMGVRGYCFSHPWTDGAPPSLDTLFGGLPEHPSRYFIHDLTLDPSMQRRNMAAALVPQLVNIATTIPLARMALVAVNGSEPFWTRMGFQRTAEPALQAAARAKYDDDDVHMQRDLA